MLVILGLNNWYTSYTGYTGPPPLQVRAVIGHTYMLTHDEELWEKELPANVEVLLAAARDPLTHRSDRSAAGAAAPRDRTRMVSYRVPHNAAVQVYDYREKKARYRPPVLRAWT